MTAIEMTSRVEALELELATLKAALSFGQPGIHGKTRADFHGALAGQVSATWEDFQEAKYHPEMSWLIESET